jgi:hypothetical protein
MSKHTPGPWKRNENRNDCLEVVRDSPHKEIVCWVTGSVSNAEAMGDLHLIAAAPDLLEAAKQIVSNLCDGCTMPTHCEGVLICEQTAALKKAIAKAEGT